MREIYGVAEFVLHQIVQMSCMQWSLLKAIIGSHTFFTHLTGSVITRNISSCHFLVFRKLFSFGLTFFSTTDPSSLYPQSTWDPINLMRLLALLLTEVYDKDTSGIYVHSIWHSSQKNLSSCFRREGNIQKAFGKQQKGPVKVKSFNMLKCSALIFKWHRIWNFVDLPSDVPLNAASLLFTFVPPTQKSTSEG